MNVGHAIKIARKRRNLTQVDLAQGLGVSQHYVSMLENNRREPSWGVMCSLADFLHISLPELMLLAMPETEATTVRRVIATEMERLLEHAGANSDQTNSGSS